VASASAALGRAEGAFGALEVFRRLPSGLAGGDGGGFAFLAGRGLVLDQALRRLVAGGKARDILGQLRIGRLAVLEDLRGLVRGGLRGLERRLVPLAFGRQPCRFLVERGERLARVAVQDRLALGVTGKLVDLVLERGDGPAGALLGLVQRRKLDRQALEDGRGDRLFLAQGRQRLVGFGPPGGGGAGHALGLGRAADLVGQRRLRRLRVLSGLVPAAVEERAFGLAQLFADLAVAGGLPRLPFKLAQLLGELLDHVLDTGEVLFGAVQLQFGLVPALVEARDAGGLLEDAAAVRGLGVDQLRDLALPDECGRMRAGRGVGEQHLDVAGADVPGVRLVGRARVAGDAADDLERVGIVERGRGEAFGVVDEERHFREVPRRPGRGAGEDHVLHPAAAHRGGAVFAHDPAQRLEQVGLATAVRPDDPRQTVGDDEVSWGRRSS
jgi:hypothetical protein